MLTHLSIRDFAIVKTLDLDLSKGLTAITGETGAGKSIAIDALGLCLGDRAEAGLVRSGAGKAVVTANFDLSNLRTAQAWLTELDLDDEDNCLIRRVVSAEGRSKAYINGTPVPLQQLKCLGEFLVSVHGQHAHQRLLKTDVQLAHLDSFAEHEPLLNKVSSHYFALKQAQKRFKQLSENQQQRDDRRQLLAYQVSELDDFAIQENEFEELELEHKKLSNSQALLEETQLSFHQLYESEEFNAQSAIQSSLDRLSVLLEHDPSLSPIVSILNEAAINIDEAAQELRAYTEQLEIDPLKMQQVEARYSLALELARKHNILPESLYATHQELAAEYAGLAEDENHLELLKSEVQELQQSYLETALKLSLSRNKAASKLAKQVQNEIQSMNMQHAKFEIEVNFDNSQTPSALGQDQINFMVATNPGQAADRLDKVVSGGELSRIGLAIQVIASSKNHIPTMIFDEVDTGISGPTASIVGQLLRKLGKSTQVLCVTHLPQVAACGHNQMFVTKFTDKQTTETHMISLSESERIEELARLLAGDKLTESAIANAKELLGSID